MKLIETARKTVQKAVAAVKPVALAPAGTQEGYSEDARKAEINAYGVGRWLGSRRKGWLRRTT